MQLIDICFHNLQEFVLIKRVHLTCFMTLSLLFLGVSFLGQKRSLPYITLLPSHWMKMYSWLSRRKNRCVLFAIPACRLGYCLPVQKRQKNTETN